LGAFTILQDEIPETKYSWILPDPVLQPSLIQLWMVLHPDPFRFHVLE
jgi:hypothetical protein